MNNGEEVVNNNGWRAVREKEFAERQYLESVILERLKMHDSLEGFSLRISPGDKGIESMKTIELIDGKDYDSATRGYFMVSNSVPRNEALELCREKRRELGFYRGDVINEISRIRPEEYKHTGSIVFYWEDIRRVENAGLMWEFRGEVVYQRVNPLALKKKSKGKRKVRIGLVKEKI